MVTQLRERFSSQDGFSLPETLISAAVVCVLVAVAAPSLAEMKDKAEQTETMADIKNLQQAAMLHVINTGEVPNIEDLETVLNKPGEVSIADKYDIIALSSADGSKHGLSSVHCDQLGWDDKCPEFFLIYNKDQEEGHRVVYAGDDFNVKVSEPDTNPIEMVMQTAAKRHIE